MPSDQGEVCKMDGHSDIDSIKFASHTQTRSCERTETRPLLLLRVFIHVYISRFRYVAKGDADVSRHVEMVVVSANMPDWETLLRRPAFAAFASLCDTEGGAWRVGQGSITGNWE